MRRCFEQIAVQSSALTRPCYLAGPDVESVVLLAMQTKTLKALLHPRPFGLLFLFGKPGDVWMLLGVALKDTGAYEKRGVGDRVNKCFRIVDDQPSHLDALSQPRDEMLA
ncbi:hypothetical protein WS76_10935 [Burkholderia humptydooensis]|nr:hypothetical protein WS76_10935 [Burkholderia humptydooensis]